MVCIIVSKAGEVIDQIMGATGQDDSYSDEEEKRRKKRNAKPCGKGGKRMSQSTPAPEPATEEQQRRRREANPVPQSQTNDSYASLRKRRDVIDPDNVMPDGGNSEVGNVFRRVIEAAQDVIRKIRTMFTQTSGIPNENVEYVDEIQEDDMI